MGLDDCGDRAYRSAVNRAATRWTARLSGWLLLAFALGMTVGTGVKTAFDASVFAASGGAFMLATARRYAWSVDEAIKGTEKDRTA